MAATGVSNKLFACRTISNPHKASIGIDRKELASDATQKYT